MLFVYDLIEELCLKKGVTVTKMCRDCGIPRSLLTDYKKGRLKSLSADTLCRIADYFEVSLDFLCGIEAPQSRETELKALFFGSDFTVTDEIWQEIKNYAAFLKEKYKKN